MKRIVVIHEDKFFAEFITQYFNATGFTAMCCYNNVEGFTLASKESPDLIIANKESPYLDLKGFLIKKRLTEHITDVPLFLIGDFSPQEIKHYQNEKVLAFLSKRLNPRALVERVYLSFKIPIPDDPNRTPMLMDLHAKGHIFVAQIEGNFDPVKLVVLNFLLRLFCKSKKIKQPHILFIIPSLYPESMTKTNLEYLFEFMKFSELQSVPHKIQILTRIKALKALINEQPQFSKFMFPKDYVEGFRELISDIDIETVIPLDFMKKGNVYTLDLYDDQGHVIVPAMTEVTEVLMKALRNRGLKKLKYYSEVGIDDIVTKFSVNMNASVFDFITREFTPISTESFDMNILNQKQNLFFSQVKGQNMMFISEDKDLKVLSKQTLGTYFNIDFSSDGLEIKNIVEQKRLSIVFVDLRLDESRIFQVMKEIREKATRRKTTIILLAFKLNKSQLLRFMSFGTDNVILFPFTTTKIYNKVYTAVLHDRSN